MDGKFKDQNERSSLQAFALAKLSHEFRAPLSSIIGFSTYLLKNRRGILGDQELLYLKRILRNSEHLLNLVNGIPDVVIGKVSFEEESFYEEIDVASMVQWILEMIEGQAIEKNIKITTKIPEQIKRFRTIPDKFKIILMNLVSNAIKYTKSGTVNVRIKTDPENHFLLIIEVSDTGKGMAKKRLDKLLQPLNLDNFDQWSEENGLGLGITSSLCEQLGYKLEAWSELGKGSLFQVIVSN